MKNWLTFFALVLGAALIFCLTSCATRTPTDNKPEATAKGESKVLVAYIDVVRAFADAVGMGR